jgi:hypothetical protein
MRFTAGEYFQFRLCARTFDLVLGNHILRENDLKLER